MNCSQRRAKLLVAIEVLGQQGLEIVRIVGSGQTVKEETKIEIEFEPVGFGCFNEFVQGGTGLGTARMAAEQPVFASYHEGSDGVLGQVVVGS